MAQVAHIRRLLFYLWGFAVLFAQAVLVAVLTLWGLQVLALAFGADHDWVAIFEHLVLSVYLLMLFPGQMVWTLRLQGPDGSIHTIVGDPNLDSEA